MWHAAAAQFITRQINATRATITTRLVISGAPGQLVWLAVAPRSLMSDFWPEVAEYNYLLSLHSSVVETEETSWGSVKAIY